MTESLWLILVWTPLGIVEYAVTFLLVFATVCAGVWLANAVDRWIRR